VPRFGIDDDLDDNDLPDEHDLPDDDDSIELVRCRVCRAMIAEDAPQCPKCGTWGPESVGGEPGLGWKRGVAFVIVVLLLWAILHFWHGLGR
jgi:hypothetical protein